MIWLILALISICLLVIFWKNKNAVWGGFTFGIIIGLVISLFFLFKEGEFYPLVLVKGSITGTIIGFGAELLGKISDRLKGKS